MRFIRILLICNIGYLLAQDTLLVELQPFHQRSFLYNRTEAPGNDLRSVSNGFVTHIIKKPTYNSSLGILLKRRVRSHLWVCYGFHVFPIDQYYSAYKSEGSEHPGRIRLRYIGMPLLFQFNFIDKQNFTAYISVGPQLALLVFESGAMPYYYNRLSLIDAGSAYHNFALDGMLISGIKVPLSTRYALTFNMRLLYGFIDPEKKDYKFTLTDGSTLKMFVPGDGSVRPRTSTIATGVGLGVSYKLR